MNLFNTALGAKNAKKLILTAFAVVAFLTATSQGIVAFADECESQYGGGEKCLVNKRFEIDKKVRLCDKNGENCSEWKDKVTDVEKGDKVQFKIKIKNLSDEEASEITDFDDMKMKDNLPDELYWVDGDGLTERWDNFDPGESKTFEFTAKVDASEYDLENFEKCVVNKASVYWDDKFEGADTATVCYGNRPLTELPKTGGEAWLALGGFALILGGLVLKKTKFANR